MALAVRVVHLSQIRSAPFFDLLMGDSRGYDEWAQRIAAGDWLGHDVFYQAPLYPYLLGVIYAIAGRSVLLVRIVQALIGSASCALVAVAGSHLFSSRRAGIAAGLMLALYAPAVFFDGLLQKSTLDVFFMCLALWLISRTIPVSLKPDTTNARHSRTTSFLWLGLAMGGLALTRENAIVLTAVIAVWTLVAHRIRPTAFFLAGAAIVLVPVAARNAYVGGGFYVTTSQAGPNFYIGNNPRGNGTYQSLRYGRGAPEYERVDATELAEYALRRSLTPAEVSSYWTNQAFDFIASQPAAWLRLMARKIALLWNAAEMVDTEAQETHAEWSFVLRLLGPVGHFGVLVPLALIGMIATWQQRRRLAVVYAMLAVYAASVVVFYVFARYRYPLVPFLALFAGAGVAEALDIARARATLLRPQTIALVGVAAVFVNWPIVSASTMRAVTESNVGVAFQTERRLDEAIAHYRKAIALGPDYAPAYNNLGSALRANQRRDEAVAAYNRALQLQPEFAGAHFNLANLLLDEGQPREAAEHFERALRVEPASADVQNNLGIALAGIGRLDDAIAAFRRAIALDPQSAKAHRNLGDALSTAGASREALDSLRAAVRLDPRDAATRYDLASALLEAGLRGEAILEFRETLRLAPTFVEAHNNLGIALGSEGKLEEAIEEFRRALQIKPDFADARRNLAMAMEARKGPKP